MSQIKLITPDGYFEKSMQTTMEAVGKMRRKRMAVLSDVAAGSVAAVLAVFVAMDGTASELMVNPGLAEASDMAGIATVTQVAELAEGVELAECDTYYAMEAEMARLDIFMEINQ